ncbi:MAG: hypothetical protein Q8O73_01250 [Thalassospira sp.]|nr:hypothetical protein [Thalassospira sp.]
MSHNYLVYSNGDRPGTWVFAPDGIEKTIDVAGRFSVNNSLAMRDALPQECGLTISPPVPSVFMLSLHRTGIDCVKYVPSLISCRKNCVRKQNDHG